jgi:hypothetical protein
MGQDFQKNCPNFSPATLYMVPVLSLHYSTVAHRSQTRLPPVVMYCSRLESWLVHSLGAGGNLYQGTNGTRGSKQKKIALWLCDCRDCTYYTTLRGAIAVLYSVHSSKYCSRPSVVRPKIVVEKFNARQVYVDKYWSPMEDAKVASQFVRYHLRSQVLEIFCWPHTNNSCTRNKSNLYIY